MAVTAQWAQDTLTALRQKVIAVMSKTGEDTVCFVRDRSADESWIDHTGNLRSSVGYAVSEQGTIQGIGGFAPTSAPDGNGSEGIATGKQVAQSMVSTGKYELTIVAGMEYASEVEALENKDVLTSGEIYAKEELPKNLKLIHI